MTREELTDVAIRASLFFLFLVLTSTLSFHPSEVANQKLFLIQCAHAAFSLGLSGEKEVAAGQHRRNRWLNSWIPHGGMLFVALSSHPKMLTFAIVSFRLSSDAIAIRMWMRPSPSLTSMLLYLRANEALQKRFIETFGITWSNRGFYDGQSYREGKPMLGLVRRLEEVGVAKLNW